MANEAKKIEPDLKLAKNEIVFQGIKLKPALAWVILTAANSPCDCFIKLSENNYYMLFQKKGTITRKALIHVFMKIGIFEVYIPEDHYRMYVDLVESIIDSAFVAEKIALFKRKNEIYNLLLPPNARVPHGLQKLMTEMGINADGFSRDSLQQPIYPKDIEVIKCLYEDIDLSTASMDEVVDNTDKIEIENLKKKNAALVNEIEQYTESLQVSESELAQTELDVRKAYEELSKVQISFQKASDDLEEIKRKYNIAQSELEALLAGHKDAKQIYAGRITSLEKRLEEIRAESQDFKLKFAREIDKNKELTRTLTQTQGNLSRTAIALKKMTDKNPDKKN